MGNIGSQTGNITQKHNTDEQQWAHSFPRTQPRLYQQHKVLPERDARQKLRHTDNGEILQSGGTLSGRHNQNRLSLEFDENFDDFAAKSTKTYLPNQRDPLHKSGPRYTNGFNHHYRENMKKFGSEPDLRHPQITNQTNDKDRIKGKKKYKAPPPPKTKEMIDNTEWDDITDNSQMRRTRLFKTRAETKKTHSSPVNKHKIIENNRDDIDENFEIRDNLDSNFESRLNRLSLPEMKITDNFHQELKEATKRLRENRNSFNNNDIDKEKLKTLDHNFNKKDNIRQKLKDFRNDVRCGGSGKESSSTDQTSPTLLRNNKNNKPKLFYFGMDENRPTDNYTNDIVDKFATNLHAMVHIPKINSSESDISSEIEIDENQSRNGIDLQLRPILPKKQLEIPRFSPAAAWRLLSVDSNPTVASTIASDDIPVFVEDKIEKFARPPPPTMQIGPRSNDKSGDSGISGDAGPVGYDDGPEILLGTRNQFQINSNGNRSQGVSWTPQQDLGDDSSMEEGLNNENSLYKTREEPKYSNKPHVFSLSLPRDNHLSSYMADKTPYSSLQKLKRSVSGVLGGLANKKDLLQLNLSNDQSDNWFLSKSAPNSLNNGFNSLEIKSSKQSDDNKDQLLVNTKQQNSGRLMYLPEFDDSQDHRHIRSKNKDEIRERSRSADRTRKNTNTTINNNNDNNNKLSIFSKSCENINGEIRSSSEPEDLQDPKIAAEEKNWKNTKKSKRFTFQSTVRQIERKRLAEKLSREAEKKEKQRLRELEAMQKVEEEFQKKRAREKATIRQQLRLFSMDDTSWNSLPPNLDVKDKVRPEPDGAVSSSTTSSPSLPPVHKVETKKVYQKNKKTPSTDGNLHKHRPSSDSSDDNRIKAPVTQILSEYRHPQREYKDYMSSTRYLVEHENVKHTTVHPQVTCNMPKAKGQNSKASGTNYRKDFAHGVKSTRSVGGSTYSEDSQSRNNSPRMYHSKYTPITRF